MKKGFTLIELLAVIVILAIIALISVPMILGVIEKAKKGAAQSSALSYIDAAEKASITAELNNENLIGDFSVDQLMDKVKLKGTKPSKGTLNINSKGIVTSAQLCINNYEVNYDGQSAKVKVNNCDNVGDLEVNYKVFSNGEVIYFNPETNLKCSSSEAISTNENKNGCMKWYAFNDLGNKSNTLNLLLDHNTKNYVAWNSSGNAVDGMNEVMNQLILDTQSWNSQLNARLITADEVAKIVGNNSWSSATNSTSFYLETGTNVKPDPYSGNYGWLYDKTSFDCELTGCYSNSSDETVKGYWTSDYTLNSTNRAWSVYKTGQLYPDRITYVNSSGVRPVITVLKEIIK